MASRSIRISRARLRELGASALHPHVINVGEADRAASTIGGIAMTVYGIAKRSWSGAALALAGSYLVYRGVSGRCLVYDAAGFTTASPLYPGGILVEKSIVINAEPEELYRYWSNFENLPNFMEHLDAVWMIGDHRWRWVAKAPAGLKVEWDADVTSEQPYELIAWRSLEESDIPNEGTVSFIPLPDGRGTQVQVQLRYYPPAGRLGAWIASLFGEEPSQQVEDDLRRFKHIIETGEIPTTDGQSSGRDEMDED